ncbi:MAG: hypothetical protein ACYTF4_10405 [Planctomycetota bacterium]
MSDDGPGTEVVMSCRVRLARNIAGFPFVGEANDNQRLEILNIARRAVLDPDLAEGMIWVDLRKATPRDRLLLVERHSAGGGGIRRREAEHHGQRRGPPADAAARSWLAAG